jgi:hypothetical protein
MGQASSASVQNAPRLFRDHVDRLALGTAILMINAKPLIATPDKTGSHQF